MHLDPKGMTMVCLRPQCTTVRHTRVRSLPVMSHLYCLTSSTQFVGQGGEPVIPRLLDTSYQPSSGPHCFRNTYTSSGCFYKSVSTRFSGVLNKTLSVVSLGSSNLRGPVTSIPISGSKWLIWGSVALARREPLWE